MNQLSFVGYIAALCIALHAGANADEPIPHHQDRPPGPALSPQEAITAMKVPEGFSVELVASEPDIVNPIAMTFDERGRIWVTESLEYPRKAAGPGRDRVKILEDTDGDGRADKFSIFTDSLNIPSGIAVGYGGVWVANSPDILFYPDADRDGRPDGPPQTIVTGFGRTDTHELPNSLTWGPDGYLYGLNGVFNQSNVKYAKENPNYKADHPGWQFTCALFRIHPVTREFEIFCEGTSNPWGLAFDPEGSAFVSACVIDHLWHLVRTGYYHRQGGPYPPFTWKIDSIVKHTHQKAAYCGLHYYDSDAYPEQYRNKLYMGNIHGNCINVDKLQRDGSTYFATGEPDFLTANDAWFMPVAQKTGPDGCLYILDWYDRYHCYQDANRDPNGIDRLKGRLYRIRYKDTPRAEPFDLGKESNQELFARLSSGNDFIRDAAQRLLIERQMPADSEDARFIARIAEKTIFDDSVNRDLRFAALKIAVALRKPETHREFFRRLLAHSDDGFRTWTLRSVSNAGGLLRYWNTQPNLKGQYTRDLLLQKAILAGVETDSLRIVSELVDILAKCGDDKLIPHIVWQNLHPLLETQAPWFVEMLHGYNVAKAPAVGAIIPRAMERMFASKQLDANSIARLFEVARNHQPTAAGECLRSLAARVQSGEIRGDKLTALRGELTPHLAKMLRLVGDPLAIDAAILAASWHDGIGIRLTKRLVEESKDNAARARALRALAVAAKSDKSLAGDLLDVAEKALSNFGHDKEFAGSVLAAIGELDDPRAAEIVLKNYPAMPADAQPKAIELLTQRVIWAKPLVEAIGARKIPASALNVNQVQRLMALKDKELAAAVNKHWGSIRTTRDPARESLVAEMRKLVRTTPGEAHRGIEVFNRVCGQCHKIYGQGQDVGPDITSNGRASIEQLLSNVFDPSLVIGAAYQARTVQAADGRIITGLLVEDSPQRIVLKVQGGKQETIAREDVEAMKVSELSLMPEGLEKQLKPQEIADLFAFITLDKHPDDPAAKAIPAGEAGRK